MSFEMVISLSDLDVDRRTNCHIERPGKSTVEHRSAFRNRTANPFHCTPKCAVFGVPIVVCPITICDEHIFRRVINSDITIIVLATITIAKTIRPKCTSVWAGGSSDLSGRSIGKVANKSIVTNNGVAE